MALSKTCCPLSLNNEEPQPSTSVAAAKQMKSQENQLSDLEPEKKRIHIRASMICSGCRCGWLCCDCTLGCMSCKQRRRFCYCQWASTAVPGQLVRIPCLICSDLVESCKCKLAWRCKWCTVSIEKCKRGGCVTWLPSRHSLEAATYVEIFNREDECDEDEIDAAKWSVAARNSNFNYNRSSNRSPWSVESSASSVYASSTTLSSVSSGDVESSEEGKSDV